MCIVNVVSGISVDNEDTRAFFIQDNLIALKDLDAPKAGVVDVAMILLNVNTNKTEQV